MRCMREKKMLKWFTRNTQREGEWERPHILRHSFVHVVRVGTAAQACRPATGTGTPPFHRRKLDQHSVSVLKGKKIPTWFQAKWKNRIFYLPMCSTHVRSLSLSSLKRIWRMMWIQLCSKQLFDAPPFEHFPGKTDWKSLILKLPLRYLKSC